MMQAEIRIRTWPVCSVMGCGRSLFGGRGGKCLDCAETAGYLLRTTEAV
jgi:hypothetical protein